MDDCYTLVGTNGFSQPMTEGLYCVQFRVAAGEEIVVVPGDVIGFHADYIRAPSNFTNLNGGIQLDPALSTPPQILLDDFVPTVPGQQECDNRRTQRQLRPRLGAPVLSANVGKL